jgi:hypothetical protein
LAALAPRAGPTVSAWRYRAAGHPPATDMPDRNRNIPRLGGIRSKTLTTNEKEMELRAARYKSPSVAWAPSCSHGLDVAVAAIVVIATVIWSTTDYSRTASKSDQTTGQSTPAGQPWSGPPGPPSAPQ